MPLFRASIAAFLSISVLANTATAATAPSWWTDPATRVLEPGATPRDYSPVTLGQLKYVATQAKKYLDLKLAAGGGAGTVVNNVCQFSQEGNYSPANLGQLKHIAKPFYDRLAQIHYNWNFPGTYGIPNPIYPWSVTTGPSNAAPATLGQLKFLFAFELSQSFLVQDTDNDELPDWHENLIGSNINLTDSDGDGIDDASEVLQSANPLDPNNHPVALASITRQIEYIYALQAPSTVVNHYYTLGGSWKPQSQPVFEDITPPGVAPLRAFSTIASLFDDDPVDPLDLHAVFPSSIPNIRALEVRPTPKFAEARTPVFIVPGVGNMSYYDCNIKHYKLWLTVKPAPTQPISRTFIRHHKQIVDTGPAVALYTQPVTFTIPANATQSEAIELTPNALDYAGYPSIGASVIESLLPVDIAPDVLAVNSDFDEGRIDSATGYAIPDCDDPQRYLGPERAHQDGNWAMGTRVTEDMHQGWFGVKPSQMGADFWAGSTVTIKKIIKTDPDTNKPESGEVRFYATDGVNNSAGYQCIEPYNLTTHAAVNLVGGGIFGAPGRGVYGPNTDISASAKFWIEGVKPGKITLEWRYVKGSTDFKYEQTFRVLTEKSRAEWLNEVMYQIRLQTKAASGTAVDVATYHPGSGFNINVPNVLAIYSYYRQLFRQMPEKFMWAGMAKTAAAPIYAGMSDLTEWYYGSELTPGIGLGTRDAGTWFFINGLLLNGQRHIFQDMAWGHRAYQASGIGAIEHAASGQAALQTTLVAWRQVDAGIRDNSQILINQGNGNLLLREQQEVVQDDYVYVRGLWIRQPPAVLAWWVDAVILPINSEGLAFAPEWLSANSNKNPLNPAAPHSPGFRATIPGGRLDNFADRWAWTSNPTNGMLQMWTGGSTGGANFDAAKRLLHAGKSMQDAASVYSYDPGMLPNE
jgi:hypothetical protein